MRQYNKSLSFLDNSATVDGPDLFGGLLDRCIPSPFAVINVKESTGEFQPYRNGIIYIGNINNITLDSITSLPVKVCFFKSEDYF